MEELNKVTVYNGILSYWHNEQQNMIKIPYYCIPRDINRYKLFADFEGEYITKLVAKQIVNGLLMEPEMQILPIYSSSYNIKIKNVSETITFSLAITQKELRDAYCLIIREHYIPKPCPGLILIAKSENRIVGCIILSKLTYCNPNGRYQLASESGKINGIINECNAGNYNWQSLMKKEYKEQYRVLNDTLQIAWISRFVVDSEYQSVGIGSRLLEELESVATKYRFPSANYIEVISSYKKKSNNEKDFVFNIDNNIFLKNDYSVYNGKMYSSRIIFNDDELAQPAIKKYFYKCLANSKRSLK